MIRQLPHQAGLNIQSETEVDIQLKFQATLYWTLHPDPSKYKDASK